MATEYKTPQQARDVIFDRMGDITIKGIRPDKNIGIQSYCATYVYRMAWYIVKGVFANVGSGAQAPRTGFVEPNNDSGCVYAKALENLGFNVINRGSKTRADLIKYCDNKSNFSNGDIVNYWHIDKLSKESCYVWGHTQMYLGDGVWESSYKYNYSSMTKGSNKNGFVYRGKGNAGDLWFFQHLRLNGVPAYNDDAICSFETDSNTALADSHVDKSPAAVMKRAVQCARYLMNNLNMTKAQACGVVGNFLTEDSTLDPNVKNAKGCYGIAQWCDDRKTRLMEKRPNDYNTLEGQLAYVVWEMTTPGGSPNHGEKAAYNAIIQTSNCNDAAITCRKKYERPREFEANDSNRVAKAQEVFNALNS